ncbi:hypothetical protein LZC95_49310 [Pendulispora brunnea]|uniref:Photosynthetic reaction center cytochrome c subunit n=1 Tax=Pendulispora brunnea TaxID=2905690 RepID=A0ABZ2KC21_9BACT
MSDRRFPLLLSTLVCAAAVACFKGERLAAETPTTNSGPASLIVAREQAGGKNEGPLGYAAPVSRSHLYDELAAQGIHPETLGPLNEIKDPRVLLGVMNTFTRSLGVRCSWCHIQSDYAAATARKAVAAFMWDAFVGQMQLVDGGSLYCDSCHHQSTIFLHRNAGDKLALAKYMQTEYVDQLRRRDGQEHGCATCHGNPINARFLPRISDPEGYQAPALYPGMQP